MTETPKQPSTQEQPATSKPPVSPQSSSSGQKHAAATPAVFGDGSTQEQQDQLVQEAEEANAAVKAAADAEREARSQ